MKNISFLLAVLFILFQMGCMEKTSGLEKLRKDINDKLSIDSAEFGIAFKDLQSGQSLTINENKNFHAASTMKTPVLIELYRQASVGKFSLDDSITIKNSFRSIVDSSEFMLDSADDSEFDLYKQTGHKAAISDLAYKMIILSSNLATNLLIELVKPDSVMKTMRSMGANDIKVLRGVEDGKAFEKGLNNAVTAHDLALIYKQLAEDKLTGSQEMIKTLLDQRFNEIIPAQLPKDVKVAHKTGSITGVQHDSGIVFLPGGRKYVLVLLSKFKAEDEKKVIQSMADVSKMVYDYMMAH
jgi:beta-lactamase class A